MGKNVRCKEASVTWRGIKKTVLQEKPWILAALLIVIGCVARLLYLGDVPYGLNLDEASSGYEAWALLQSGIDRNGKSWPILFMSWGSGQNVLMSYLAMPFIAVLGLCPLSIRLPNALAGCVSLFVMWRLARHCRGERFGLCALFLLAINPWHIMASRWALESNLLPALLLGACYFLSRTEEKPRSLYGAAVCLGLSPYAYGTVFFLLPFFLIWTFLRLRKSFRMKTAVGPLLTFALIILPIVICQAINILQLPEIRLLGITFPRLVENRQDSTSILGGGGLEAVRNNLMTFLRILHDGDDGETYNALPFWRGGFMYFFGAPLTVLGFCVSFRERKEKKREWPVIALLLCALICVPMIEGNINRLNMLWMPVIYFCAVGADWIFRRLTPRGTMAALAGMTACFMIFTYYYMGEFQMPGNYHFHPGLIEAIEAAEERKPESLYVTGRDTYIIALFCSRTPPETYVQTVEYGNPELRAPVERFSGFEFADLGRSDWLILTSWEAENLGMEVVEQFEGYVLCRNV